MVGFHPLRVAPVVAALLGACAVPGPRSFPPGTSASAVTERMGAPVAVHALPAGGRRLEYGGGAYGRHTYMLDFDGSDRLVQAEQVRTEAHFNAVKAGMTAPDVLAFIGRPATTWAIPRQRQIVWSYRYDTPFCQWFMVGMGPEDRVVDTAYGPDPLCDDNDFFSRSRSGARKH